MTTLSNIPNSTLSVLGPDENGVKLNMITGPDVFQPLKSLAPGWVPFRDYLNLKESTAGIKIADFGSGTGQFAVWTKEAFPDADVYAYDIDPNTEKYMEANAELHGVDININIMDVANISDSEKFDSIIASPPFYQNVVKELHPEHEHAKDPDVAVYGGPDGLDVVKTFINKAKNVLNKDGVLVILHATSQSQKVENLLVEAGFTVGKTATLTSEKDLYILVPAFTYAIKN